MAVLAQAPAYIVQVEEADWAFVNGGESFSDHFNNYFTAWMDIPGPEGAIERHIICRLIVPLDVARKVRDQATKEWTKGGH